VVSSVWQAELLNVLVARSKLVRGRLRAKAVVADPLDIMLEEHHSFDSSLDDFLVVRNSKNTTPLYGLHKLRGVLDPGLEAVSGGKKGTEDLQLIQAEHEPFSSMAEHDDDD
jgi:hypothetical protein